MTLDILLVRNYSNYRLWGNNVEPDINVDELVRVFKELTEGKKYSTFRHKPFYGHLEIHFQNGERGHIVKRETIK